MAANTERCDFLIECLDLPAASQVEEARWEAFQVSHLNDDGIFRIENKSRQIAWSFLIAMEAVANAVLYGQSSIFISINLEEATEKIVYVKRVLENLQIGGLPKLIRDNRLMVEFDNGARIISSPSKAPRGKARFWVYADEWAHQPHDRSIYTGALPIISKGGRFRGGSSPMGAGGLFWEVFTESMRPYSGFTRSTTAWWEIQSFCKNVREAVKLAPAMATAQRVELFGNDRIKAIFTNMILEDFQQEYECTFVDEVSAWISWDEIRSAQSADLFCPLATATATDITPAIAAIDALAEARRKLEVELYFVAGMDIGRTRNASELFIVGIGHPLQSFPLRCAVTLAQMPFPQQQQVIAHAMKELPILGLLIDRNGLGMQLAEWADGSGGNPAAFPMRAAGVQFTNASKTEWATLGKKLVQEHKTPLPINRDMAYQIHSIKRTKTAANNLVFDTARNEKHHADKFWAWVLALVAASAIGQPQQGGTITHHEEAAISPY